MIKSFFGRFKKEKNSGHLAIRRQTDFDKKLVFALSKSRMPTFSQLKYLPRYLARSEKFVLLGLFIVLLLGLGFWGVKFSLEKMEKVPDYGGEYVEGLVGAPQYVNPILAQTNDVDMDLSRLVFSGLFKYDSAQVLVSDLAERYEISEDKRVYTIFLKDNLTWHDGEKLTAADVVFTASLIKDPLFRSPLYSGFRGVTVEKVDDRTLKFILNESYAPFLGMLTFGILPEHLWYNIPAQSANLAEYNIKPVGSGPFKFKSLTKDKNGSIKIYTLVVNDNFYDKKPYLEKLIFKFYPDYDSALAALQNQNIEAISFLPEETEESLQSKKFTKYFLSLPQYTAIFFDQKNNEFLKDAAVRKALALAIDKNKIVNEALGGKGEAVDGPILPGYVGHSPDIKKIAFDQGFAKDNLEKAGYKLAEGEPFRKKGDKVLKIVLTTVDRPEYNKVADLIKTSWEAIGVQVELSIVPSIRIQREIIRPRAYESLMLGTILGFDPDPYPFWHSSQVEDPGLNLSLYANRNVDKLLEEARQTDNPEERAKKYLEFQNILADDIPAIFLYSPRYTYVVSALVFGIDVARISVPSDRFAGISNWYKETKRQWK
ncbi:peptide ABC transporter substrate-binding protein [Patescibacteria group bacterium]|nr:peptide ABC transporter substrate-binding protein [Patescibacteria group bacterium]